MVLEKNLKKAVYRLPFFNPLKGGIYMDRIIPYDVEGTIKNLTEGTESSVDA